MILWLDDEPQYIQGYAETLEYEGLETLVVGDVEAFFSVLSDGPTVEAVVVDVMLQEGYDAGVSVLDRLRVDNPDLPVVLLTNRADMRHEPTDGITRFLVKRDVTPIDLYDVLQSMGVGV